MSTNTDVGAAPELPAAVTRLDLPLPRARSGKVRESFDLGDWLLLVATDRVSAFDCVLERGIPGKGRVLTSVSRHWFEGLDAGRDGLPRIEHHLLSADAGRIADELDLPPAMREVLAGRAMLVRKARPIPVECVVRGYLEGSALEEYRRSGGVAGQPLPPGLRRGDRFRRPLFTPARKALSGHDENVGFDDVVRLVGGDLAGRLRELSLDLYEAGAAALAARGLLLADTKFEFGLVAEEEGSRLLLIDELLTPDSSRLWEASTWEPGRAQVSFDKQPLRDWLEALAREGRWDKRPPAPDLPPDVVRATAERYAEAHLRITGRLPEGWPAARGRGPGGAGPERDGSVRHGVAAERGSAGAASGERPAAGSAHAEPSAATARAERP